MTVTLKRLFPVTQKYHSIFTLLTWTTFPHILSDISQICGDEELLYKGYCLGVIALEEDDVCNRVFLPDAYPLAIKSEEIQNFLLANRDKLPLAAGLVIGLKSDVNGTYR